MPITAKSFARESLKWIFGIFCCPCFAIMLACAYSGRTCRCGQARRLAAERRFAKRNTRTHAAIIVAPAPPPAYLDLPNPGVEGEWDPLVAHIQNGGNRVFCVRPTDGVLTSGNIAGTCPGFRIVGKPELKAVVRRTEWKGVLKEMKRIRDDVVLTSPLMREKRWWRKKGPTKIERSWVEEACEMFTTVAVDGGEKHKAATEGSGCFEVWKVDVEGVGDLVHDESWRGVGGDAEYIDTKYLWTTRVFTSRTHHGMWMLDHTDAKQVEDLFEGRWNQAYIDGEQEPLVVPDLTNYFVRFRPRRSIDSGNLEVVEEEEEED